VISDVFSQAYVQQLESCRLKLMQLEQEVDHAKRQVFTHGSLYIVQFFSLPSSLVNLEATQLQGLYIGDGLGSNNLGFAGSVNSGLYFLCC